MADCMLAPQWWKSRPVQPHNDVCGVETLDLHYRRRSARKVHARFRWRPRSVVKPFPHEPLIPTGGDGEEYAPETLLICDHTCAIGVKRFSFPTYSFQDLCFASKTVRRAAALAFLNAIIFSVVECRSKVLNALRRSRSAARHSSVHHGTGIRRGTPDVLGICLLAAPNSTSVK